MTEPFASTSSGPATNRENRPVEDPTRNVMDLVEAANQRQDDLRAMQTRHFEQSLKRERVHIEAVLDLRAEFADKIRLSENAHSHELRTLESGRIDAIRAVDVAATAAAATAAENRAGTLAAQVSAAAEAMRTANADAVAGAQAALSIAIAPLMAAVQEVQRRQYEAAGAKEQTGEARLNYGAVLGAISVALVIVFGVLTLALTR